MSFADEKRSILFTGYTAMGNGLTFEQFKEVATNAKEVGLTHVDLGSAMLDRSRWQLDNNGNYEPGYDFYPEYTAAFADPFKFHCPKALEKHLPVDLIKANHDELARRAAFLDSIGMKACIIGAFPQWLPESVYQEHPEWRGPRCDMPFRSRRAYFAPCVDNEEVLDLYREVSRELGKIAPNLDTMIFMTNDSGTSFCWNSNSYPGKNGPEACKNRTMEERVTGFLKALESGMPSADALAYNAWQGFWCFSGKISPHEGNMRKENIWFVRPPQDKPVAYENPLSMIEELENAVLANPDVIVINIEQTQHLFKKGGVYYELLKRYHKSTNGMTDRVLFLKDLIESMKLDDGYDLLDAWQYLYRGIDDTSLKHLFYYSVALYGAMSCRTLVRPFVPIPENLTEDEKYYYKKHVFDSLDRQDYELDLLNIHGLRNVFQGRTQEEADRSVICWNSILTTLSKARASYQKAMNNAGSNKEYLKDSMRRLDFLMCVLKNLRNCCQFQAILDRAKSEGYSSLANSDILEVVMRDEYDNTTNMIRLLEDGGAPLLPLADTPENETTFLFGPDLADQLRKKQQLMMKYWRDSQILFKFRNRFHERAGS